MARSHKHRVPAAFGGIMDTKTGRKGYWLGSVWDWAKDNATELVKMAGSGIKGYLDYKDAKKRGELEEAAYGDYLRAAEEAGQEAKAAIELNLTPMTVSNVPGTKADITDYTAATGLKHGGISGLRKKYYDGTDETEVLEMDEEPLGDFELQKEEGVEIGPMVSGKYTEEELEAYENYKYDMNEHRPGMPIMEIDDFLRFWYSGKNKNKKMMADADDFMTEEEMEVPQEEILAMIGAQQAAQGGIIGLRHGGRPGYETGVGPVEMMMNPAGARKETEWITQKKPNFFEDLFLKRTGGGGKDYMIPDEASTRADLNEVFIIGGNDMAKAEKIESERSIQGLYDKAIRILDKAWDIDQDLHEEINQTFIEAANDPDVSPANAYYTIIKKYGDILKMKKGGRVKRNVGGIMDLGGMEKDYRFNGGFVPIGAYERKDDVPARLSKNEFVFTADAVRAAGGGSINKGAKRMYDTMKTLEARPEAKRMTA